VKHNLLYVFDNLEFGGGERGFVQIINRLCRKKYKIMVACLPTGVFIEKIKGSGAQVSSVDMQNRFNPMVILRLVNLMKRENVDIVHSQGGRADFFARMAAKLSRVPIVVSTVQMPVEGFNVSTIKRLIYILLNRFSERFVDRFIVVSDALEKMMIEKQRIESQRVVKIYNGIEIDEFCMDYDKEAIHVKSRFREEMGFSNSVPVIGAIGRLVWQKGFEYFIEAIPGLLKEFKEARFLIVGEGELEEELKVKSKRLGLEDKLTFTGFRSDIKEILASIDICILPSLLEGLPMILLEAMAMGKPIVATDIDGIKEVLADGEAGLLVPPRNMEALSDAIITLLGNEGKSYQMGMAARKIVKEEFGVDVMVQKVEKVYDDMLRLNVGVVKA
jgi:glycosyltransferase involved in cell wall biosynthesis